MDTHALKENIPNIFPRFTRLCISWKHTLSIYKVLNLILAWLEQKPYTHYFSPLSLQLTIKAMATVKFLCSYGGRIIPRYPDNKLRYHGGHTRVLSVQRSISFAGKLLFSSLSSSLSLYIWRCLLTELAVKLGEVCGMKVSSLRCQLPADDLDALVTVSSDEDLANLMEEYDLAATALKIRVFLSPPLSTMSSSSSSNSSTSRSCSPSSPSTVSPKTCPVCVERSHHRNTNKGCYVQRSPSRDQFYLVRNWNSSLTLWQWLEFLNS